MTIKKSDWDDFWYNSEQIYPPETKHNYNELVDHLVSTMTIHSTKDEQEWTDNLEPPFDTEAYANYRELVNKEREKIDTNNITESLYRLGYQIDNILSKIISQLDTIIEDNSVGENDNEEMEITVDPLTHKVTYNAKTNEYKVVRKED